MSRLSLVTMCCGFLFTTACSDSTGPSASTDPARLAAHFDSLYVAALGDGGSEGARSADLGFLEIAPALGARPVAVTVTTDRATELWRGFMFEVILTTHGVPSDSTYLLMAYRDADAHTMLSVEYNGAGSPENGSVYTDSTLDVGAGVGSGSAAPGALGGTCATPSTSLASPEVTFFGSLPCERSTFIASATMQMPNSPPLDLPFQRLSVSPTPFNGVRLVEGPAQPGVVGRLRALLRASPSGRKF